MQDQGMASFSIGVDYKALLDQIAKIERRNKTQIIRDMIDARARTNGLQPVFDCTVNAANPDEIESPPLAR